MKTPRSWKAFAGLVLHALLAGIMILSASGELFTLWFTYESYNN
jgi:hypothetical protein